jgi:hypothetical protein
MFRGKIPTREIDEQMLSITNKNSRWVRPQHACASVVALAHAFGLAGVGGVDVCVPSPFFRSGACLGLVLFYLVCMRGVFFFVFFFFFLKREMKGHTHIYRPMAPN